MDRNRIFLRVIGIVFGEVPPRVVARFGQRGMACVILPTTPQHVTSPHAPTTSHTDHPFAKEGDNRWGVSEAVEC